MRSTTGKVGKRRHVASWHIADVQRLPGSGPLTGALPTFGGAVRSHPYTFPIVSLDSRIRALTSDTPLQDDCFEHWPSPSGGGFFVAPGLPDRK